MSIESQDRAGVPLSLRLALQLEQAWDLLDPDCEPGQPGIPDQVFEQFALARVAVEAALKGLRPIVDELTEADRMVAGERLSEEGRSPQPDTDYDL